MIEEPRIALAASPREWGQRLHRHVADHGGARVRATVLHPRDAVEEDYDVLVADDTTSFLTAHLVGLLHERGRAVLGVFDPSDERGRDDLLAIGADAVLPRDAPPESFVELLAAVAATCRVPRHSTPGDTGVPAAVLPPAGESRSRTTAVAAAGGGTGATELAAGLAAAWGRRGEGTVLVDGNDVSPALAVRLGLALYPNLRAAVDVVEQGGAIGPELLVPVPGGSFWAVPGLGTAAHWSDVRPAQALEVLRVLARGHRQVVVDVGAGIEDLPATGSAARHGLARHVLASVDTVVVAALPTPPGVARLVEWTAEFRQVAPDVPLHVACNRAPSSAFKRAEVSGEILEAVSPAGLWFVPADPRVEAAVWEQRVVAAGPFTRAVAAVAGALSPAAARTGRRRRRERAA